MYRGVLLSIFILYGISAVCKGKPKIVSQKALQTEQGQSITIQLTSLGVVDENGTAYPGYPSGFTLEVFKGDNYKLSGSTVTPDGNFVGTLTVPVRVSQGKEKSDKYNLKILVVEKQTTNTPPVIIGQLPLTTQQDKSLTIKLTDLLVTDPDDSYPAGFTLKILPGNNYVVSGSTIQPAAAFAGTLAVPVVVNDGEGDSAPYTLSITVLVQGTPVNDPPSLSGLGATPVTYQLTDNPVFIARELTIEDPDDKLLSMAEVGFETGYYQPDGDALIPTFNSPDIRVVLDGSTGVLFLIGEAPIPEYVRVLRSLTYQFSATDTLLPQSSKLIYFVVSDGTDWSERRIVTVEFTEELILDIPTVFTPNNDNANDTWKLRHQQGAEINGELIIRVYNKRGSLVYEASSLDDEWDGTLNGHVLPADSYFFLIELNQPLSKKVYQGYVTILH